MDLDYGWIKLTFVDSVLIHAIISRINHFSTNQESFLEIIFNIE